MTTTRCECGETQPHAPARYIAPGVDGIDSTTLTCPGAAWEAQGSLGDMATALTPAELRKLAADALAAAEWLEDHGPGGWTSCSRSYRGLAAREVKQ